MNLPALRDYFDDYLEFHFREPLKRLDSSPQLSLVAYKYQKMALKASLEKASDLVTTILLRMEIAENERTKN